MASSETAVPLAAEELAELLGVDAALALAKPKRGRTRKPAVAVTAPSAPQWLPLADLAGSVLSVSRADKFQLQGRLTQRDGVWGLWVE